MSQDNEKPYNPASMPQYQSAIDARSFGALESKVENLDTRLIALTASFDEKIKTYKEDVIKPLQEKVEKQNDRIAKLEAQQNFRAGGAAIVGGLGGWLLTHFFNK